jgi:hypothetical protein
VPAAGRRSAHTGQPPITGTSCIEWIKLHTNRTNAVALGNDRSASEVRSSTINRKGGFLAAVRGYEDSFSGQPVTRGPLQQLQFVWGITVCPEPAARRAAPSSVVMRTASAAGGAAAEPVDSGGVILEGGAAAGRTLDSEPPLTPEGAAAAAEEATDRDAAGGNATAAAAAAAAEPQPTSQTVTCPVKRAQCDASARSGAAFCPAIAPFDEPTCNGGCCVSAGKCKRGFCARVGLGAEVFSRNLFCWGVNGGAMNKLNRCRNLGCRLAVPGCVGDFVSGACVGDVVALAADVDDAARQWIGAPCLQTVPGGLPVNALGKVDLNGAYAAKL